MPLAVDVWAADLDADGDIDAISAYGLDGKVVWYENPGKPTNTPAAQRWKKHTIDDQTPTLAFKVQRIKKGAVTVTGVKFVGKHTATVPLDPGQWWFFSGTGKKTYFIVHK